MKKNSMSKNEIANNPTIKNLLPLLFCVSTFSLIKTFLCLTHSTLGIEGKRCGGYVGTGKSTLKIKLIEEDIVM